MSRSYRRTPKMSCVCCDSERSDKKIWHSKLRSAERTKFMSFKGDFEDYSPVTVFEVVDVWEMGKDGSKHWFDQGKYPQYMRK